MFTRLVIIAITPTIALGTAMYLIDRYEREPPTLLLKVFFLGALSVIPVAIIQRFLIGIDVFTGLISIAYTAFIIAGLTEEYFKRAVVMYSLYNNKNYNEKLDGIVYCVFSALGFATVENIMYVVFRFPENYHVGLMRGLLSVPAHVLFGVTMGYYLSKAKYTDDSYKKRRYFTKSLTIPVIFHGIFNFILMSQIPLLMFFFIPFVIYLWIINVRRINEYSILSKENNKIIKEDRDE
ncbi:PrsW family glutamic-type intramembrane protease [Serpentinicella sp. ANB-PHB4]|uniref:PrsW family intramembrane metalloprotease n=1 Tax=Serpentinicella sp. ANB-PHB4 TaxID=3074076 RepID=UPI00286753A4|nr:PrsW family glutamic-type intramembrane protease [Serpentinicella sp. ANB-PHB4]MDR5659008.1 PrsW family glutamic-type intramembrane protease [Serpentinicella sp. ANB-PHB4]